MTIAIVNYGLGNLGSVRRAFNEVGAEVFIADQPSQLDSAERIVLPGVGSFADGMRQLNASGWVAAIRDQVVTNNKPLLGICLGMQLLATEGMEGGHSPGLGLIPGKVLRLDEMGCDLRIPHVGWNDITLTDSPSALLAGIPGGTDFYFVHSFVFNPASSGDVVATTDYGLSVVAAVQRGKVFGTQFHPEKSSKAGFKLIRNFLAL